MCFAYVQVHAQNILHAYIRDGKTKEPLPGAIVNIIGTPLGSGSNANGYVQLTNIPNGKQYLEYKYVGYQTKTDSLFFPMKTDTLNIYLDAIDNEMDVVVVNSTRSSRTISDIPTRIELIAGDELDEKANMKPGDIRMILSESTGIQTLQTSPISGNTDIKIQGLSGRYTQILKDGFPLYGGFSGGLGLLQTPPLDLKQVEIIKGSSSTLYGGGAIAGLINLISKTPGKDRDLEFIVNGTSAKGLDIDGFYSQRFGKIGITIYAARNSNEAYAPDNTIFTAIPQFTRYTFNPRLFYYPNKKTEITFGVNSSTEVRRGGDVNNLNTNLDTVHTYFEDDFSNRISTEFQIKYSLDSSSNFTLKNSYSYFNRHISSPGYLFDGNQQNIFTELDYYKHTNNGEWIAGMNYIADKFSEIQHTAISPRNYTQNIFGVFIKNTIDISQSFSFEAGIRMDRIAVYGLAPLPLISILYKMNHHFSSRLGGGLGYKVPTIFTDESEKILYQGVMSIDPKTYNLEKSEGINWDINYKGTIAKKLSYSINQLFFYTLLTSPLELTTSGNGIYYFQNLSSHIDALGTESNIKLSYGRFKLFLGYTYTNVYAHNHDVKTEQILTPHHHTNSVLIYEQEGKWKAGLEAYYYSQQLLSDGTKGRDYWLCGFMAEKIWKRFSLFINFENMLNSRQTRFGSIYTGTLADPQFKDIYAPLDGFVTNGGLKLKL